MPALLAVLAGCQHDVALLYIWMLAGGVWQDCCGGGAHCVSRGKHRTVAALRMQSFSAAMDTPATLATGTPTSFSRRWTSVTYSTLGQTDKLLQNSTMQHVYAMSATSRFACACNAAGVSCWPLPKGSHSSRRITHLGCIRRSECSRVLGVTSKAPIWPSFNAASSTLVSSSGSFIPAVRGLSCGPGAILRCCRRRTAGGASGVIADSFNVDNKVASTGCRCGP